MLCPQDKRQTLEALDSRISGSRNEVAAAEGRVSAAEAAVTKREEQVAAEAAAAADKAAEASRWVQVAQALCLTDSVYQMESV
jgi:hypothetical protein